MTRKLPSTSLDANKRATQEMREDHHAKIIAALTELRVANYEQLGAKTGLDKIAIARRLSELERAQIIYKPGLKSNTSSGRQAFNYSLTNQPPLSVSEQVEAMVNNILNPNAVQGDLF